MIQQITAAQCVTVVSAAQDPYLFFREWLGIADDKWTDDQRRIIDAIVANRRVAVTSGNGTGKTFLAAAVTLWYLYTHYNSRVITTASSFAQVAESLWSEIRTMWSGSRRKLGGKLLTTRIEPDPNSPTWAAVGISTNDPTSFQGRHAPYVLVIIDEATGVEPSIWTAAELMAYGEHDRILAMGNPTDAGSEFFRQCEIPGKWLKLEISGELHPNYIQRRTVIPGAISYERIKELEAEWGREHPVYQARVLGRWSRSMGRMFPQFESYVGRHVYDPDAVDISGWHTWWAGCDWGFAHNSATFWARYDGRNVYVVREFVREGLDSKQLARKIAELTNPPDVTKSQRVRLDGFYLSHECFNYNDGPRSRADEMGEELKKAGLPWPTKANKERVDGCNVIRTMLNNDTLRISKDCPKLIAGLKRALRNPDRPEDMLKEDGDDEVDGLRYLLATNPRLIKKPLDVEIQDAVRPFLEKEDYLGAMFHRFRLEDKAKAEKQAFSLGRFVKRAGPRRS